MNPLNWQEGCNVGESLKGLRVIVLKDSPTFGIENSHFSRIVPITGTIQHATNRAVYGFQCFDSLATT
jgi:hypothetical protein